MLQNLFGSKLSISLILSLLIFNTAVCQEKNQPSPDEVPFEDIDIKCLANVEWNKGIVINSLSDYKYLISSRLGHPDCYEYTFPNIDFTKKTLLIYLVAGGGCNTPNYIKKITLDIQNKTYLFNVNVQEEGNCRPLFYKLCSVIIDKIFQNYTVKFKYYFSKK